LREHCGRELIVCCKSSGRHAQPANEASIPVVARGFLCQPNVLRLHTEKLDFEDMIDDFAGLPK